MAANAEKLDAGTKELFKRYPNFKILVYPTHRTAAAPKSVYDNTFRNATKARAREGGNAIDGAHGGIPFPIAKAGNETIWNSILHWQGVSTETLSRGYIVTPDGQKAPASTTDGIFQLPYYQDNPGDFIKAYETVVTKNVAPPIFMAKPFWPILCSTRWMKGSQVGNIWLAKGGSAKHPTCNTIRRGRSSAL